MFVRPSTQADEICLDINVSSCYLGSHISSHKKKKKKIQLTAAAAAACRLAIMEATKQLSDRY